MATIAATLATETSATTATPPIEATESKLFARVQIANLERGMLPIPQNLSVVIEIGVSDEATIAMELLDRAPNYYVVSCEPLLDKYSRSLARHKIGRGDQFQPLGEHHSRGVILPLAVGDRARAGVGGALQTFHVGRAAGCSSLLGLNARSNRLKWCRSVRESREVPTISLHNLLGLIGPGERPIDFMKIDAQGMDLRILESAGRRLKRVRRFTLELLSDDCHGIYDGQPNCSTVVAAAAALGYTPAGPIFCTPRVSQLRTRRWRTSAFGCEVGAVFVAPGFGLPDDLSVYHNAAMNGCSHVVDTESEAARRAVPNGMRVLAGIDNKGAYYLDAPRWDVRIHLAADRGPGTAPYACAKRFGSMK